MMYDGRTRAKMSRKSKHSIMKNCGFGDLSLKRDGIEIIVPQKLINKGGVPHTRIIPLLNKLDESSIIELEERGCQIRTA